MSADSSAPGRADRHDGAPDDTASALAAVGMAMVPASIEAIELAGEFRRVVLRAPVLAAVAPGGMAPVFKVFLPRSGPLRLPRFDIHRLALPDWEADPERPIVRAYTAIAIDPAAGHVTFDALDLSDSSWVRRARVGDELAVIGFKHGLRLDASTTALIAIGDASALPALETIAAETDAAVPLTVITTRPNRIPPPDRTQAAWLVTDADPRGFPVLDLDALTATPTTAVWIAGELRGVARTRALLLDDGATVTRITPHAYWKAGCTRDELDRDLYRRYRDAAQAGADISDPVTSAGIELSAGDPSNEDPPDDHHA